MKDIKIIMKECTDNFFRYSSGSCYVLPGMCAHIGDHCQRESLSPLEHHPQHPVDHSRGKQDKNSLRVVSAIGPFSANLHCSDQTCPVVIFKHVFLLSPAFHNFVVKCLPFSLQHLATQKSRFVGTGSPHLCPLSSFVILLNLIPRLTAK